MYQAFYGLSAEPFRLTPDHRFSFNHRSYARAKAYLEYGVQRAEGFVMITGRPGTGKTTLINDLLEGLDGSGVSIAKLVSTQVEAGELLRLVAFSFGIEVEGVDKATVLQRLEHFLRGELHQGRRAVLIVDEAQDVAAGALEELRLLTNLEFANQPLLQVFLVGQEELRDVVRSRALEQLHQRMIAACHLQPLTARETRAYVEYRLKRVGWQNDPRLADGVFGLIHHFSQGVPRRINQVCSRLLLHGFVEEKHALDEDDVQMVLADLREEMLTPWDERPADDATAASLSMAAARDDGEVTWEENPAVIEDGWAKKKTSPAVAPAEEPEPPQAEPAVDPPSPNSPEPPINKEISEAGAAAAAALGQPEPVETARAGVGELDAERAEPVLNPAGEPRPGKPAPAQRPEARPEPGRWAAADDDDVAPASVYVEPEERRPPPAQNDDRDNRGGPGRWAAAAGVTLVVGGALAAAVAVPGPWSPAVEGAEQWVEDSYAEVQGWFVQEPVSAGAGSADGGGSAEDLGPAETEPEARPEAAAPDAGAPAEVPALARDASDDGVTDAATLRLEAQNEADPEPVTEPPQELRLVDAEPVAEQQPAREAEAAEQATPEETVAAVEPAQPAEQEARATTGSPQTAESGVPAAQPAVARTVGGAGEQLGSYGALRVRLHRTFGRSTLNLRPEADGRVFLDFTDPITFGYDSAELEPDYRALLDRLSQVMAAHDNSELRIVGYTDSRGSPAYNQYLSEQRAKSVAAYLAGRGVNRRRLIIEGRGSAELSLAAPAASRRVDLYLQL